MVADVLPVAQSIQLDTFQQQELLVGAPIVGEERRGHVALRKWSQVSRYKSGTHQKHKQSRELTMTR